MIEDRRALTRRRGRTAFVNMKYSVFHRVCAMTDVKYEIRIYTAPPKVKYEICNYAGGREKGVAPPQAAKNFLNQFLKSDKINLVQN